jgi:hypothetical protein
MMIGRVSSPAHILPTQRGVTVHGWGAASISWRASASSDDSGQPKNVADLLHAGEDATDIEKITNGATFPATAPLNFWKPAGWFVPERHRFKWAVSRGAGT